MPKRRATLCLIDDDPHDAFLARRIFAREAPRLRVVHRADADAICADVGCLRLEETGVYPDFLFLDINMPKADGFSILRELKRHRALRRIPVFVFTTSENPEHVATAYAEGAAAFLVKPPAVEEYVMLARAFVQFWLDIARRPSSLV